MRGRHLAAGLAALALAGAAAADEAPVGAAVRVPEPSRELPPGFADGAPLWSHRDPALQLQLEVAVGLLGLERAVAEKDLCVVLVDITRLDRPSVAALNGDFMMYAASMPKIAVLLGLFHQVERGEIDYTPEIEALAVRMIRKSSNSATTELMHRVGKAKIAEVLRSPRYRFYDQEHNGGIWAGKDYARAGLWRRDPLHNLSHGATVMQVARFYYMLETDQLVTPEYSRKMKEIMGGEHMNHKFVAMLRQIDPKAQILRKSGTWRDFHADSVLVRRRGRSYIAVALTHDAEGKRWLQELIVELDAIVMARAS